MPLSENLSLVAELSVGLAGFASLVAILGRRQGRDTVEVDAIRLQWMLGISLFTAAFALLPAVPFHAGISETSTWRMCAGAFAASSGAILVYTFRRVSRLSSFGRARGFFVPNSAAWSVLWIGLGGSAVILLLAAAVGLLATPAVAYLWGLYAWLAIAALLFLRLVHSLLAAEER